LCDNSRVGPSTYMLARDFGTGDLLAKAVLEARSCANAAPIAAFVEVLDFGAESCPSAEPLGPGRVVPGSKVSPEVPPQAYCLGS